MQPSRPALLTSMSMAVPRSSSASASICAGLPTSRVCSVIAPCRGIGERGEIGGRLGRAAAGVDAPAVVHELAHHFEAEPSVRTGDQHRRHGSIPPLPSSGGRIADPAPPTRAKPYELSLAVRGNGHRVCRDKDRAAQQPGRRDMRRAPKARSQASGASVRSDELLIVPGRSHMELNNNALGRTLVSCVPARFHPFLVQSWDAMWVERSWDCTVPRPRMPPDQDASTPPSFEPSTDRASMAISTA